MNKVEKLIRELRDKDWRVRWDAALALREIGDERAVEPLINALRDGYSEVCRAAAEALGKIGDKKAIEPLIIALRSLFVRYAAIEALKKIEPEWHKTEVAKKQVPEFVKILVKAKDEKYCNYLKELIEKIFLSHKLFLDSYPYLLCKNCMLRAKQRKVKLGLFKRWSYVVCCGCDTAEALIIGIK